MPFKQKSCEHLDGFEAVAIPENAVCQECVDLGDSWVHLRLCVTCGKVACCDSSKNKHATKHHQESSHPLIVSAEPDEYWVYCYTDKLIKRYQK